MADEPKPGEETQGTDEKPAAPLPVDTAAITAEVRDSLGIGEEKPAEAAAAAPAAAPADATGEAADTLEAAGLTAEQAAALAQDPKVVQAVLGSDYGAKALDDIITNALSAKEHQAVVEKQETERRATLEEALRKGQADGDWAEFGRMAGEQYQEQQRLNELRPSIEAEVTSGYDAAFTSAFADEIKALSEEELASLNRERYRSEDEWQFAVMNAVANKARHGSRADFERQLTELQQANASSATAARARDLAAPSIPGGSPDAATAKAGLSISELAREAFADEIAELQA